MTATDGTNTISKTINMDSYPPPSPRLWLSEEGTRAVSRAHFEWSEVTAPSGVTYSIQVATDKSFRDIVLVLEKKELTRSEYTLSQTEKLTKKQTAYYWRVQAVDGAGNESGWSGPSSFYVDVSG